ncbi:MAG: hypothetical protein Q4E22_03535 [Coriobacteriia bacterium]|nr:hypothetical protein [Coriobacteriia bacterium]
MGGGSSVKFRILWDAIYKNGYKTTGAYDEKLDGTNVKYDLKFTIEDTAKKYHAMVSPKDFVLLEGEIGRNDVIEIPYSQFLDTEGNPIDIKEFHYIVVDVYSADDQPERLPIFRDKYPLFNLWGNGYKFEERDMDYLAPLHQILNTSITGANYDALEGEDLNGIHMSFTAGKLNQEGKFDEAILNSHSENIISNFAPIEDFMQVDAFNIIDDIEKLDNAQIRWLGPEYLDEGFALRAMYDDLNVFDEDGMRFVGPDGKRSLQLGLQALFKSDNSAKEQYFNDRYEIKLKGNDVEGWELMVVKKNPSAPNPAPAPAAQAEAVAPKPVFKRKALDLRYARDDFYNKNGVYKPVSLLYGPYKPIAE